MSRLRVGIICGGCSKEHDISLRSAHYIFQSIDKYDFDAIILWIDRKGNWYIQNMDFDFFEYHKNNYQNMFSVLNTCSIQYILHIKNIIHVLLKFDIVFPIVHGILGEDGTLQGLLSIANIPFVGSGVLGSAISMDKVITKNLLYVSGLSVVPFQTFSIHERKCINFSNLVSSFGLPFFIKPSNQGSSIGISKIFDYSDFHRALNIAFSYSHKILIEPSIIGRELEYGILGNNDPQVSVCGEIVCKNDTFYTYSEKYLFHEKSQILIPAIIDNFMNHKMRYVALRAFRILNCFDMARVDMFLTIHNQILVSEVNTLPGFTKDSMYPKLWKESGLNIKSLITKLIELALYRFYKK